MTFFSMQCPTKQANGVIPCLNCPGGFIVWMIGHLMNGCPNVHCLDVMQAEAQADVKYAYSWTVAHAGMVSLRLC